MLEEMSFFPLETKTNQTIKPQALQLQSQALTSFLVRHRELYCPSVP